MSHMIEQLATDPFCFVTDNPDVVVDLTPLSLTENHARLLKYRNARYIYVTHTPYQIMYGRPYQAYDKLTLGNAVRLNARDEYPLNMDAIVVRLPVTMPFQGATTLRFAPYDEPTMVNSLILFAHAFALIARLAVGSPSRPLYHISPRNCPMIPNLPVPPASNEDVVIEQRPNVVINMDEAWSFLYEPI